MPESMKYLGQVDWARLFPAVQQMRDAIAFLQPGGSPGPAGEIYLSWWRSVERPISVKTLHRTLPDMDADHIATWLDAAQRAPVPRAVAVLRAVREDRPRDVAAAVILGNAALAQALGWTHILPLLALGLKRGDSATVWSSSARYVS